MLTKIGYTDDTIQNADNEKANPQPFFTMANIQGEKVALGKLNPGLFRDAEELKKGIHFSKSISAEADSIPVDRSAALSGTLQEASQNPVVLNRLKLLLTLKELKKADSLLEKLQKSGQYKRASPENIRLTKELIQKQIPRLLGDLDLFDQLDTLLSPEGAPISLGDYTKALNGIFEISSGGKGPFVTAKDVERIFEEAKEKRELLSSAQVAQKLTFGVLRNKGSLGPTFPSLKQVIERTETWLKQTEADGWKNSMLHEEEMVQGIMQSLEADGESTVHCHGFLKESEEIRGLLRQGKLEEAKEFYLGKHLRWREQILEIHRDNEQVKQLRNYTIGLAIVIASGGIAGIVSGAVTAALETAGVSPWAMSAAGLTTNGLVFTATSRSLNAFVDWSQNKQIFDSKKDLIDHLQSFATESLMMAGMMGVLGKAVQFSRTSSLLPNIAQQGLPKELIKDGILDLTQKESPQILAKLFEEEIAKMSGVDRFLFKGKEFAEELLAFTGWEMLEAQVHLLAEGKAPSLENLKVLEAILDPRALRDRAGFLLALKGGNRLAEPFTHEAERNARDSVKKMVEQRTKNNSFPWADPHPSLSSAGGTEGGQAKNFLTTVPAPTIEVEDMSHLSKEEQQAKITESLQKMKVQTKEVAQPLQGQDFILPPPQNPEQERLFKLYLKNLESWGDPNPRVRIRAIRALMELFPYLEPRDRSTQAFKIGECRKDEDADVRYHAMLALKKIIPHLEAKDQPEQARKIGDLVEDEEKHLREDARYIFEELFPYLMPQDRLNYARKIEMWLNGEGRWWEPQLDALHSLRRVLIYLDPRDRLELTAKVGEWMEDEDSRVREVANGIKNDLKVPRIPFDDLSQDPSATPSSKMADVALPPEWKINPKIGSEVMEHEASALEHPLSPEEEKNLKKTVQSVLNFMDVFADWMKGPRFFEKAVDLGFVLAGPPSSFQIGMQLFRDILHLSPRDMVKNMERLGDKLEANRRVGRTEQADDLVRLIKEILSFDSQNQSENDLHATLSLQGVSSGMMALAEREINFVPLFKIFLSLAEEPEFFVAAKNLAGRLIEDERLYPLGLNFFDEIFKESPDHVFENIQSQLHVFESEGKDQQAEALWEFLRKIPVPGPKDPLIRRVADNLFLYGNEEEKDGAERYLTHFFWPLGKKYSTPPPPPDLNNYSFQGRILSEDGSGSLVAFLTISPAGPVAENLGKLRIVQIETDEKGFIALLKGAESANHARAFRFHLGKDHPFAVGDEVYLQQGVSGGSGKPPKDTRSADLPGWYNVTETGLWKEKGYLNFSGSHLDWRLTPSELRAREKETWKVTAVKADKITLRKSNGWLPKTFEIRGEHPFRVGDRVNFIPDWHFIVPNSVPKAGIGVSFLSAMAIRKIEGSRPKAPLVAENFMREHPDQYALYDFEAAQILFHSPDTGLLKEKYKEYFLSLERRDIGIILPSRIKPVSFWRKTINYLKWLNGMGDFSRPLTYAEYKKTIPDLPIKQKLKVYKVHFDSKKSCEGILSFLDQGEPLPNLGEVWEVKSVLGDQIQLTNGQKIWERKFIKEIEKEESFRITERILETAQLSPGDRVIFKQNVNWGNGNKNEGGPYRSMQADPYRELFEGLKKARSGLRWLPEEVRDYLSLAEKLPDNEPRIYQEARVLRHAFRYPDSLSGLDDDFPLDVEEDQRNRHTLPLRGSHVLLRPAIQFYGALIPKISVGHPEVNQGAEALRRLLRSNDERVVLQALKTYGDLRSKFPKGDPEIREWKKALKALLKHPDGWVRLEAEALLRKKIH